MRDRKNIKLREIFTLLIIDSVSLLLSFYLIYFFRFRTGLIENYVTIPLNYFVSAAAVMILFWVLIFAVFGLYRYKFIVSRLEELISIFKAGTIGILIIYFITVNPSQPLTFSKIFLFNYWILVNTTTGIGRIIFRTVQKQRRLKGYGLKRTMIIGDGDKAVNLYNRIQNHPVLGLRVVCFASEDVPEVVQKEASKIAIGKFKEIPDLIEEFEVGQVILAVENISKNEIMNIIGMCDGKIVDLKITSDIIDITSGLVKSDSVYGVPLIDMFADKRTAYAIFYKRFLDILISVTVLVLFFPLFVIVGLLIRINSRGNVFYKQKRVGKNKKIFEIYKFRTMVEEAEKGTGPVWAAKNDKRVTKVGNILRKTRIDELPQFINILEGDMSLIGPRPERPVFVEEFIEQIAFYTKRMTVKPGITGWAQIKHSYDTTIEDVKQKLEYDLFYIENISFLLDLKIFLKTLGIMFKGKGR